MNHLHRHYAQKISKKKEKAKHSLITNNFVMNDFITNNLFYFMIVNQRSKDS